MTAVKKVVEESKKLLLFVCDTSFSLDRNMWDYNDHKNKVPVYSLVPFTVFASFSDNFLKDEKALRLAESRWMKHLHPESELKTLEWNFLHANITPQKLNSIEGKECSVDIDGFIMEHLNRNLLKA